MGVARIYQSATPYVSAALDSLDYAQTADVIYFFSLDFPVNKVTRGGHTDWTWAELTWGPTISPPTGETATASTPNSTGYVATTYNYVVTSIRDSSPAQESRASGVATCTNDLTLSGNTNLISWVADPDADRYNVYKEQAGGYGYIGATSGTSLTDNNIQPILSDSPPVGENPFDSTDNYPSTGTFHQQRLWMARTRAVPNGIWATQSADFENLDKSRPVRSDDALSFALVADKINAVNQIASFDDLIAFSSDAVWAVSGGEGDVITPSDINPKRQSGRGSSRLKPLVIDSVVFFQPNKGSSIRTIGYSFELEGYRSTNIAIFSPHFFENHTIVRWAWMEEPYACIWALRDDGALLCFTWEEEQQVWGWTLCETDGVIEELGTITEGGQDRLYLLVRRTINGVEKLFHERLALPHTDDYATACHLDCSVTQVYDPAQNVVDQLWHLEGATVSAFYDGYSASGLVVTDGQITLPSDYEATIVTVGLPYSGRIETLPPTLQSNQGSAHVNRQQIERVVVRAIDTKGIEIGANGTALQQVEERDGSEVAELPDIDARDYDVPTDGNWTDNSYVVIEQNEPFPARIVGIFYDMKVSPR